MTNTDQLRAMAASIEWEQPLGESATLYAAADEIDKLRSQRDAIRTLCLARNNPGVNVGAHELAGKVLRILGETNG